MLPPNYLEDLEEQAIKIYNKLELEIIKEIAERIANVGYANTVVKNDVMIAQEMGLLYRDVINLVSQYNNSSYNDILRIFEDAGATSIENDDNVYKLAGLNPINIKQDKSILDLLIASAEKTNGNLQNLVMTTANTSQIEFINAMNTAYMEVSTGVKSYSQSIIDAVDKVSTKGGIVQYPSGYKMSLESATRMNVITGVNQTCGKLQLLRAEELGWDLMELTAHSGARPEHAEWQGKVVSLSGKNGYLRLDDIGYGTVTGFKGVNCRHDWRPYYEGSSRTYIQKELEAMQNEKVTYNGKEMSRYDAQQLQRKMERQIRQDKKDIAGVQGILTSNNKEIDVNMAQNKLKQLNNSYNIHNNQLNDLVKQVNARKDNTRLYVGKVSTNTLKDDIITNRNLFQKLNITENNYKKDNNIQEQVAKLLNIDGKPIIVDNKTFESAKGQEIIRYIHGNEKNTVEEVYRNSIYGDIKYSNIINSQYGRGIYFGKKEINNELEYTYGKDNGKAIDAKISENAKIKEFNSPISYIKETSEKIQKLPKELQKLYENERSLVYMLEGYDGIKINSKDYYCIYNRKVLIVKDE